MTTITTEQFNALPEERRKYFQKMESWVSMQFGCEPVTKTFYTPIQINLEDAERVLEELIKQNEDMKIMNSVKPYSNRYNIAINIVNSALTQALNNLKQLTK